VFLVNIKFLRRRDGNDTGPALWLVGEKRDSSVFIYNTRLLTPYKRGIKNVEYRVLIVKLQLCANTRGNDTGASLCFVKRRDKY
jgi:hypothetical protein